MSRWRSPLTWLWDLVWFRDGSPTDLAAARIIFSVHALWILLSRQLPAMSDLPAVFWSGVPSSTQWRYLLFHGHGPAEYVIQGVAVASLVGAAIGFRPRVTCLVSALLLYHLAPLETIIWSDNPMERGFEVTILALVILAFSPCGDALALLPRKSTVGRAPSWEYYWPLVLIQLFIAEIYLFSGWAKLHHAGLGWMSADNIRRWLLVLTIYEPVAVYTSLGRYVADRPILCGTVGVTTILAELTFPLVLFFRRARIVLVPLAVAFHVGIFFSLNIAFLNLPQLLIFVNWSWLQSRLGTERAAVRPVPATVPAS